MFGVAGGDDYVAAMLGAEGKTKVDAADNYFSKDFEWEELRSEVESDPSLLYHLTPFTSSSSTPPFPLPMPPPSGDADAWRIFHRRHSAGKFFKERRYLLKEFPEITQCAGEAKVLEVGCGNGSTALPILRAKRGIVVYACDCSEEILEKAKEIVAGASDTLFGNQFHTFLLDLTVDPIPDWLICSTCQRTELMDPACCSLDSEGDSSRILNVPPFLREGQCCVGEFDFITMIFTLSAIPFSKMHSVIRKFFSVLRPGGFLLFRDYGLYDMTMLRFPWEQRVGFREYMRSDGTYSYFFSLEIVRGLFLGAGLVELELEYCCVRSINRRSGKNMQRVWVHGKFQKPA